jgi:hypothetical protein
MTARLVARRFLLRASRALLGAAIVGSATPSCFSAGSGSDPPPNIFYFPVGLAVSKGGNALYAVNSDFDLQWNGGTLQSYNLFLIRRHTAELIEANLSNTAPHAPTRASGDVPPQFLGGITWQSGCTNANNANVIRPNGQRVPLGQLCAPPADSTTYFRHSAIIGAFATDLQLSTLYPDPETGLPDNRLFAPVRGDATLTWTQIEADDVSTMPPLTDDGKFPAFAINCGQGQDGRCDAAHHSGNNPSESNDTRNLTMPGEPFGMAQTEDGTAIAITHQTDTKTSLLLSGIGGSKPVPPSMQFVLDGLPTGGNGITAVPHDPAAIPPPCELQHDPTVKCVFPAFLQTSRNAAELDLLRYYDDDGSSLHRPFLTKEAGYILTANSIGTDSRGIVIDPTTRLACRASLPATASPADIQACAQRPARVFLANRAPSSVVQGKIGLPSASGDGTYDPDRLIITGNTPVTDGPSKLYLAPIVRAGRYAMRLFVVCFDSSTIFVYDPNQENELVLENVIYVGPGPFAMAFDPFTLEQATGSNNIVPTDQRQPAELNLKVYRFAYVASFRQSFVQVIDLDDSSPATFEHVVFTLGQPTNPKGS